MKSILLIKMFLGLVEMTFGLVYASFSLPKWQALKITLFAPCGIYQSWEDVMALKCKHSGIDLSFIIAGPKR